MGIVHERSVPGKWLSVDVAMVTVVALAGRVGYWLYGGTRLSPDTRGYIAVCSAWTSNPIDALTGQLIGVEYAGFTLPFCIVTEVLGASFDAWVAIQILLSTLSCCLVYATARRALDRPAGLAAGLSMAVLWESFQWTIYLLSDATFVFAVSVALWAITRHQYLVSRRSWAVAWLALAFTAVARPFGLPIVLGWLAYDLLSRDDRFRVGLVSTPSFVLALVGVIGLYYTLATRGGAWVDSTLYGMWTQGVLIVNDPTFSYEYSPVERSSPIAFVLYNAHHLFVMGVLKLGLFFLPVLPRWSTFHNVVNVVTLLPAMVASGWAVVDLFQRNRQLLRLWLTPLAVILVLIGITFIDWDWRYRAPAAPVFALLAGYAASRLETGSLPRRLWDA